MSKSYPTLPLFAHTRKNDPESSHNAADRLNDNNANLLGKQQSAVLRDLKANDGVSAKDLGRIMAQEAVQRFSWPHKRMPELETLGYVKRELNEAKTELLCFVTEKGRNSGN